jgi:hypothetical protein
MGNSALPQLLEKGKKHKWKKSSILRTHF